LERKLTKRSKGSSRSKLDISGPSNFVHVASVDENTVVGADFTASGALADAPPRMAATMATVSLEQAQAHRSVGGHQSVHDKVVDFDIEGPDDGGERPRAASMYSGFAVDVPQVTAVRNHLGADFDDDGTTQVDDDDDQYGGFNEWTLGGASDGTVEPARTAATMDLLAQPWYVGATARAECEAAVLAAETGDFLVRSRGDSQFICVNEGSKLVTLLVTGGPESSCVCMGRDFNSLIHVVEFLLRTPLVGKHGNLVHLGGAASTA
jgi:hypothetical protein